MTESTHDAPRSVVHSPSPAARKPAHLPHLDSLRAIAGLLVVLHHARLECRPTSSAVHRALAWLNEGHFCVTFFVILSGYCLTLPTVATGRLKGGVLGFLGRRARRLLPAYYVTLLGSIALVATVIGRPTARHWDFTLPLSWQAVITHALMIHNFQIATILKINHVLWSIAVEWQLYFSLPLLLILKRSIGPWGTTVIAVGLGYLGYFQVNGTDQFGLMPHYYGVFALGMLAADLAHGGAERSASFRAGVGLVAGLALVAWLGVYRQATYEILDLPFSIAGAAGLVLLARPGRVRSVLEWRPLVGMGGFAYSLYLVHAPLQHLIVDRAFGAVGLSPGLEFPILVLVGTPIIVAFAYAFSMAFERPFLSARSGKAGPRIGEHSRSRPRTHIRTGQIALATGSPRDHNQ